MAYHRDYRDHSLGTAQRLIVAEVGAADENGYQRYCPVPFERCAMTVGIPYRGGYYGHHCRLIDTEPALYEYGIELRDDELVVEPARRAQKCRCGQCPDPYVAAEIYAVASARSAEQVERQQRQSDARPLP